MVSGSLWVGRRGVPRRRVRAFTFGLLSVACGGAISAVRPWFWLVVVGVGVALAAVPALNAAVATIFHEQVPASMHGRVFGLRFAIGRALDPVGSLIGGVLVARVAEPAMASEGRGAGAIGWLIGTGDGRGGAAVLLFVAVVLAMLAGWIGRSSDVAALDVTPDTLRATHDVADDRECELATAPVATG